MSQKWQRTMLFCEIIKSYDSYWDIKKIYCQMTYIFK